MFKGSNNKYNSFNEAKSTIINSALGKALSIASDATIATVATAVSNVANRGNLNWSGSNTTYSVSAGYYSGGTLDSRTSYNNGWADGVYAADNRADANTVNYKTGYNNGWSDGVSAADNRANPGCTNWNAGRSQGQADVTGNPNGYGLYTKSQYDSNWSSGYNSGYSAGRGNIRVTSGSQATSGMENATYNGGTKSKAYINISPGGNPLLCFAYRTDHNDVAAASSSGMRFVNTGGRNYTVSSWHQFDSNAVHLITSDNSTGSTWNWWCAIY